MNVINEIKNKRVTRVLSKIKKGKVYNRDCIMAGVTSTYSL